MPEHPTAGAEQASPYTGQPGPPPTTSTALLNRYVAVSGDGLGAPHALWRASAPRSWLLLAVPAGCTLLALLLAGKRIAPIPYLLVLLIALCSLVGGALLRDPAAQVASAHDLLVPLPAEEEPAADLPRPLARAARLRAGVASLMLAVVLGIPLITSGAWLSVALCVAGFALAVLYSQTRYRLGGTLPGDLLLALALGPGVFLAELSAQRAMGFPEAVSFALLTATLTLAMVLTTRLYLSDAEPPQSDSSTLRLLRRRGTYALLTLALALSLALASALAFPLHAPHGLLLCWGAFPALLVALTGIARAQTRLASRLATRALYRACALFLLLLYVGGLLSVIVHQMRFLR